MFVNTKTTKFSTNKYLTTKFGNEPDTMWCNVMQNHKWPTCHCLDFLHLGLSTYTSSVWPGGQVRTWEASRRSPFHKVSKTLLNQFCHGKSMFIKGYLNFQLIRKPLLSSHQGGRTVISRTFLFKIVLATWGHPEIKAICQSDRNLTGERRK